MTELLSDQTALYLQPLVTVAMPVYNGGQYLQLAVLSIINQTFTNWELLIIDDGSTDNAFDTISNINDDRVKIFRDGYNKGLAARLNEAIDLAKGKYLARMDSDDISYPQRFEEQVKTLELDANLDLLSVRAKKISMNSAQIGYLPFAINHNEIISRPWQGFNMPHPTWMGKLSWFKKYYYKLPQSYYSEDYELLLRSYKESKFGCLPEVLFEYRVREKIVWCNRIRARKAVLKLQFLYFVKEKDFLFLTLSLLTFVLKVVLDFSKVLKQKF